MTTALCIFSPAGVVADARSLQRAARRLRGLGFDVRRDPSAAARHQRFAGDDEARLAALHRVAEAGAAGELQVALASRGGYGLSRLLDRIDWPLIGRSVAAGLQWVGYSDCTALQLAAIAHGVAVPSSAPHRHGAAGHEPGHHHHHPPAGGFWAGPMAADDFGRTDEAGGLDDITAPCFEEAVTGQLEAVGFRTEAGFDGLDLQGRLWGGNLTVLLSLLGTPHWPKVKGGVLFLEDVNEHPYRVERGLLQLLQAGVLGAQKAVLLGDFDGWRPSPLDRGYNLKAAIAHLRSQTDVPLLTGLPMGHGPTKVCLPQGRRVTLAVQGREAFIGW
ncbi:LD-carboxypeptidase [Aquabacterium sp. J223]|uniref:LD-carboxypeptidase n=1 Tax=Aquabacterium sp. J223 TaxID=2898431 RepID=UPI0021ADBB66|nr:LD-carboxypeptidase [Aquabacterium sp. J223]UUX94683.1 LD-carboxypeptidase [Aquabacterium sp. J223]